MPSSLTQRIIAFDAQQQQQQQQQQQFQQAESQQSQPLADLPQKKLADSQLPLVLPPTSSQPVPVLSIKPTVSRRDSENDGMSLFMGYNNDSCASSILSPISDNTSCSSNSGSASAPDLASLDRARLPHSGSQSLSFSFSLSKSRDRQPSSHQSSRVITHPIPSQCRRNEHLAVLIPRTLWKPDSLANKCDKYACKVKFSVWERKHHCRKCGGIYCRACSARTTPLLDASKLPFLLPPRDTPIHQFASPTAPVYEARVCDDCFDQLHGFKSASRSSTSSEEDTSSLRSASRLSNNTTTSTPKPVVPLVNSYSSLSTLSPSTPPDDTPLNVIIPRARARSGSPRHRTYSNPYWPDPPVVKTTKLEGDLDRYPLKDPSQTCKAAGGGRWEPKQYSPRWDSRLPDGRLRYEVEAERIEEEEREKLANPVIVDGPIRVRRPQTIPAPHERRPQRYQLPTF